METKRKRGRPTDGTEARSERLNVRTTPGAMQVIRGVLREDETLSRFVRTAMENEVRARRGR